MKYLQPPVILKSMSFLCGVSGSISTKCNQET